MRTLLWRLVVVGVVLAVAASSWIPSASAHAGPDAIPRLSLPAPTGPHRVGTTSLHLVDDSRIDPLAPTPRARELMVRLWYPAAAHSQQRAAAYNTPGQRVHGLPACRDRRRLSRRPAVLPDSQSPGRAGFRSVRRLEQASV
jgi:hypothetical protein